MLTDRILIGVLISVCVVVTAVAQIDTPVIPPERDLRDLFQRASASRIVVLGTVVKSEGITKRMTPATLEKMKVSLEEAVAGSLYTIGVTETVCLARDFEPDSAKSVIQSSKLLYIFIPRDEPLWLNGFEKEFLFEGRKYLLFLELPDPKIQSHWSNSFQLDPKRLYYRGVQRSRGIIPISGTSGKRSSSKASPVREKVTLLCAAVRPTTLSEKLVRLERLASSGDPILEREARVAIEDLKARAKPRS